VAGQRLDFDLKDDTLVASCPMLPSEPCGSYLFASHRPNWM